MNLGGGLGGGISDSHSRVPLGSSLLRGHVLSSDEYLRAFRESIVPSSLMVKQSKNIIWSSAHNVELNSTAGSPVARPVSS